jgi:uncharacterized flavoprotein (TIGR03862 family)
MAAEVIASAGYQVALYDAMPSLGRKFLLAGVGGLNITHAEPHPNFLARYALASPFLAPFLDEFSASHLRQWVQGLGIETFVGSSQRVFPADMKAAPLLRAWLSRLRGLGVQFYPRQRWCGWHDDGSLKMLAGPAQQEHRVLADALVLALGGGSWPRLGSDAAWVPLMRAKEIRISPLLPSNCGFEVAWSAAFAQEFSGAPLQTLGLSAIDGNGVAHSVRGEAMIVKTGIEGTSVYALSAILRDALLASGRAELRLDLLPDLSAQQLRHRLQKPRGKNSLSNFLRKQFSLPPLKLALLRELTPASIWQDPEALAAALKDLPMPLVGVRPLEEAISCAGGIGREELNAHLMLSRCPGVFCAGEMLDWEAPTGGYLLSACLATGRGAGLGVLQYLRAKAQ